MLKPEPLASLRKERRQVLSHLPAWIADAVYGRPSWLVGEHRLATDLRTEANTSRRKVQPCFPAVQRVVVAVADERPDPGVVQALQALDEPQLRPEAAVGAVVDVPRHQEGIDLLPDTQVDDALVSVKGGAAQLLGHIVRRLAPDPSKRAVQVQVGSVYKPQPRHGDPLIWSFPVTAERHRKMPTDRRPATRS